MDKLPSSPEGSLPRIARDGRARYTHEQRNHLLDLFETSGMTGKAFADAHGVKYPTFALWRKRRRESRSSAANQSDPAGFVVAELPSGDASDGLTIELPSGLRVKITANSCPRLLASLIRELDSSLPC